MSIVNRTLDSSEQRKVIGQRYGAVATGSTVIVSVIPYPCVLEKAQIAAFGHSGAPSYTLYVNRFITGSGFTTFAVSGAQLPPAFGTSGVPSVGMSLLAAGSSLLNLLANDVVTATAGVANTNVLGLSIDLVVRPVQDIKLNFGLI